MSKLAFIFIRKYTVVTENLRYIEKRLTKIMSFKSVYPTPTYFVEDKALIESLKVCIETKMQDMSISQEESLSLTVLVEDQKESAEESKEPMP